MSKPMVRIHNAETDEIIDREMTDAEFKEWETQVAEQQAKIAAETESIAAKSALLEKLGITESEAKLLLGQNNLYR